MDAPDTELTGAPSQRTRFRVRLAEPGAADLTLRFWAIGALGGLANKNTAHLYLRCLADQPGSTGEDRSFTIADGRQSIAAAPGSGTSPHGR